MVKFVNSSFKLKTLHHITAFVGAYGSGKSEVSANFAVWLAGTGRPVTLCDLDMINPFYRTADAAAALEARGIRMIVPQFAGTNVDVPALPPAVRSVFDQPGGYAVLDIGGEDLGARVLASLRPEMAAADTAVYMVINTSRPQTATVEKILEQAAALAAAAALELDGLVQNTNLLEATDPDTLLRSDPILQEAADILGLPVVFAAAIPQSAPDSWRDAARPCLLMERFITYPGSLLA